MSYKISDLDYINDIGKNVLSVDRDQLSKLYKEIKLSDCLILYGSGRSLCAEIIGMSQIAKMSNNRKVVTTPEAPGFPGINTYDAAEELERRFNNIFILINSGGGKSEDPLHFCKEMVDYIDETKSEKFRMGLVTSDLGSSLARIVKKYGQVVKLKGRAMEETTEEYRKKGILGDKFELGSLSLFSMLTETLYEDESVDTIFDKLEEEFPIISNIVDNAIISPAYEFAIEHLEKHNDVFFGGKGVNDDIAKMMTIRMTHVKLPIGDHVYRARGYNTPNPRPGDLEILSSYSGETQSTLRWYEKFREMEGFVLSVVGNVNSSLAKGSHYTISIEENIERGRPRRFYMRAAFVLSPLPVKLIERLDERGLHLPEYVLRYFHSTIE